MNNILCSSFSPYSPLDGVEEQMAFVEPQMRAQNTPRRRPVSVIALNGQYVSDIKFIRIKQLKLV